MDRKTGTLRARELRRHSTDAEAHLWRMLRGRRLQGYKFRRQHVLGPYILDFYCSEAGLAIEVDGGGHAEVDQQAYDRERTRALEAGGVRLLRFWNHDVLRRPKVVLSEIDRVLAAVNPPHPSPLPQGGEGT